MLSQASVRMVGAILAMVLLIDVVSTATSSRAATSNWPSETMQLAWFYKPPANDPNLSIVPNYFDTFILTKPDEQTREAMREKGVDAPILQYVISTSIHDPGSCTAQPWRNQVAHQIGDFCQIRDEQPDWFLRDVNGNVVEEVNGGQRFVYMDFGNPEWQAFFLQRVRAMQQEVHPTYGGTWDGLFLDNVDAGLRRYKRMGVTLKNYPDDASIQAAYASFLRNLSTNYFQPEDRPFHANITELPLTDPAGAWFNYMQYLDGAMEEGFAVDWSTGYISVQKWEEQVSRAEETQRRGKRVILVSQGQESNISTVWQPASQRQQFAYASYLLVADGRASFRYGSTYSRAWLYDTYQLDLGEPQGARYQDGPVYRRKFANGLVTVDPVNRTSMIAVGANATPTMPATATPSATDTAVPTATPTAVPPATSTAVATSTALPTSTATPAATNTTQPTSVPSNTPTSAATPTSTTVRTATPNATPTRTATPVRTNTPTPTRASTATPTWTSTPVARPAAPSALSASAASSSRINLTWNDNATNETGFAIERCTGSNCTNFVQIATVGSNVRSYANTSLRSATTYRYRVRAYNNAGSSAYSNRASARTR